MAVMRACVVHEHGPPENIVIEEREVPAPGPGQVRIAVRAAVVTPNRRFVQRGVVDDQTQAIR